MKKTILRVLMYLGVYLLLQVAFSSILSIGATIYYAATGSVDASQIESFALAWGNEFHRVVHDKVAQLVLNECIRLWQVADEMVVEPLPEFSVSRLAHCSINVSPLYKMVGYACNGTTVGIISPLGRKRRVAIVDRVVGGLQSFQFFLGFINYNGVCLCLHPVHIRTSSLYYKTGGFKRQGGLFLC